MRNENLQTREFGFEQGAEILQFINENMYAGADVRPSASVMGSVLASQKASQNYGVSPFLGLFDKNRLVGAMMLQTFQITDGREVHRCIQASSIFIKKSHRGNFYHFVEYLNQAYPNDLKLFMLSHPAVHKTAVKHGYKEVNKGEFLLNTYFILRPISFMAQSLKTKPFFHLISKIKFVDKLFNLLGSKKTDGLTESFSYDYSELTEHYEITQAGKLHAVWNAEVLKIKFGTSLYRAGTSLQSNHSIQLASKDENGVIKSCCILKPIFNYNRIVLVDFKSSTSEAAIHLLKGVFSFAKEHGIDAILVNDSIKKEINQFLPKLYLKARRETTGRAFMWLPEHLKTAEVKLYYGDDDMFW